MVVIMQNTQVKADLQKRKVNAIKIRKACVDGNKLHTGKNGGQMPSSLGCRSIIVVRQADECLQFTRILKFDNFISNTCLGCLNGFKMPIASYK